MLLVARSSRSSTIGGTFRFTFRNSVLRLNTAGVPSNATRPSFITITVRNHCLLPCIVKVIITVIPFLRFKSLTIRRISFRPSGSSIAVASSRTSTCGPVQAFPQLQCAVSARPESICGAILRNQHVHSLKCIVNAAQDFFPWVRQDFRTEPTSSSTTVVTI